MADAASRDFETKLTQLRITKSKTETMLSIGSVTRIKRHKASLHSIVAAVEKSKRKVEELRLPVVTKSPTSTRGVTRSKKN